MKKIKRIIDPQPIFYTPTQSDYVLSLKEGRSMELINEDPRFPIPFNLDGQPVFRVTEINKYAKYLKVYVDDVIPNSHPVAPGHDRQVTHQIIDPDVVTAVSVELRKEGLGHFADELMYASTSEEIAAVVSRIRLGGLSKLANFIEEEAGLY